MFKDMFNLMDRSLARIISNAKVRFFLYFLGLTAFGYFVNVTAFLPIIGVKGFPQQDPFQVLVVSAAVAAGILLFVFGAGGLLEPDPPGSTAEAEAELSKIRLAGR